MAPGLEIDGTKLFAVVGGLFMIAQFLLLIKRTNNEPLQKDIADLSQTINDTKNNIKDQIVVVERRVEEKINGWSERITDNRRELTNIEARLRVQENEMAKSQEDRRQMNQRQAEVNGKIDNMSSQLGGLETRMRDRIDEKFDELIASVHRRLDSNPTLRK